MGAARGTNGTEERTMRFMVLVIAPQESEAAPPPKPEAFVAMQAYNEKAIKAGVLLAAEGLAPSWQGARVKFSGGKHTVVDGPFAETKELVAGFWLLQTKTKEECIEWLKRAPFLPGDTVEIRQVHEADEFAASDPTGELRAQEKRLRDQISSR